MGIKLSGTYCEPIEDKVRHGMPDVYVDGGRWIECKFRVLVARGRGINVLNDFTNYQKSRLRRDHLDKNFAAFLFCNIEGETAFFICRFLSLYSDEERRDRCLWTFPKARKWGVSLEQAPVYVRIMFQNDHDRIWQDPHLRLEEGENAEVFMERWA